MKLTQILLALTLSSAGLMAADEAAPEAKEIASNYKTKLKLITPQPVPVNISFALRCGSITEAEVLAAMKEFGPHTNAYVSIYMNESVTKRRPIPSAPSS